MDNQNIIVNDNNVFLFNKGQQMSADILKNYINYHEIVLVKKYKKMSRYYKGKHDILRQKNKDSWKPDNKIVYNFPKKLVNTFGGYFLGSPVHIDMNDDSQDKILDDWLKSVNFNDVNFEVSKEVDIYGRSYYFVYQNENGKTKLTNSSPQHTFVIYENSIEQKPLFAVQYYLDTPQSYKGILYTMQGNFSFSALNGELILNEEPLNDGFNHFIGIPVIEAYNNEERIGLFEDTISIIDAINHEMSEKANDFDAQADSILKIVNASLDDKTRASVRSNRTIEVKSVNPNQPVDIDYINKADNDGLQEHLIQRNIELLYQISGIANINDETFGNASGTALSFKLLPMSNIADMKARKFETAIKKMLLIAFSGIGVTNNIGNFLEELNNNLSIQFIKTTPKNLSDEANTLNAYLQSGAISTKTALSTQSIVDDPQKEIERVRQEQEERLKEAKQLSNGFSLDSEKD